MILNNQQTKELLSKELDKKKKLIALARVNFWAYCLYMDTEFFQLRKKVMQPIAESLMRLDNDESDKLAISIYPRIGKSYIITQFCGWKFGNNPKGSIMRNATTLKLARKFSKDLKNIMKSKKYLSIFPDIKFKKGDDAAAEWTLEGASQVSYFGAGAGGQIIGYGANMLAITDDIFANFQQAYSENVREERIYWRKAVHGSRIEGNCKVIDIGTRWHSEDHFGVLEKINYYDEVIKIPALDYVTGKSTCPEFRSDERWEEEKLMLDDFLWEAEYQQIPIDVQGKLYNPEKLMFFTRNEFVPYEADRGIMVVDTADVGTDDLAAPVFRFYNGFFYLVDVVFSKELSGVTQPMIVNAIIENDVYKAQFETNREGRLYKEGIKRMLLENKYSCQLHEKFSTSNKETRILMSATWIMQNVKFRSDYEKGSQYHYFMKAMFSYMRNGKNVHDDAVDALSMFKDYVDCGIKRLKKESNIKRVRR